MYVGAGANVVPPYCTKKVVEVIVLFQPKVFRKAVGNGMGGLVQISGVIHPPSFKVAEFAESVARKAGRSG